MPKTCCALICVLIALATTAHAQNIGRVKENLLNSLHAWSESASNRNNRLSFESTINTNGPGAYIRISKVTGNVQVNDDGSSRVIETTTMTREYENGVSNPTSVFEYRRGCTQQHDRMFFVQWSKIAEEQSLPDIAMRAELQGFPVTRIMSQGGNPFYFGLSGTTSENDSGLLTFAEVFTRNNAKLSQESWNSRGTYLLSCETKDGDRYMIHFHDQAPYRPLRVEYHSVVGVDTIDLSFSADHNDWIPTQATIGLKIDGERVTNSGSTHWKLTESGNAVPIPRKIAYSHFNIPDGQKINVKEDENVRYEYHEGEIYKVVDAGALESMDGVAFVPARHSWLRNMSWLAIVVVLVASLIVLRNRSKSRHSVASNQ